jgi:hypothetical protein
VRNLSPRLRYEPMEQREGSEPVGELRRYALEKGLAGFPSFRLLGAKAVRYPSDHTSSVFKANNNRKLCSTILRVCIESQHPKTRTKLFLYCVGDCKQCSIAIAATRDLCASSYGSRLSTSFRTSHRCMTESAPADRISRSPTKARPVNPPRWQYG